MRASAAYQHQRHRHSMNSSCGALFQTAVHLAPVSFLEQGSGAPRRARPHSLLSVFSLLVRIVFCELQVTGPAFSPSHSSRSSPQWRGRGLLLRTVHPVCACSDVRADQGGVEKCPDSEWRHHAENVWNSSQKPPNPKHVHVSTVEPSSA